MTRHLDLLAVLYFCWGLLALVTGVAVLIQAAGAMVFLAEASETGRSVGLAAGFTTGLFLLFGCAALIWGAAHTVAGRALTHRRPWARRVGLGLAIVNLFFLPFGTALAGYAFWVLLNPEARLLFTPPAAPGPTHG